MERKKEEFNASILAQEVLIFSEKADQFRTERKRLRKLKKRDGKK